MKKLHFFSAVALCLALVAGVAIPVQAQSSRVYLAGYLGLNISTDQGFTESSTSNSGNFELSNSTSFAGALGMRLSNSLRLEGEFSYRDADFSSSNINGAGTFGARGNLQSAAMLANAYYDFDLPSWPIQPYVGAGLGYAWHTGEFSDSSGILPNESSDASGFIWNIAGGVKYRPNPEMAFTAGYRYLDTFTNLEFGSYDLDYSSHEFRVGMEWDLPTR